MYSKIHLWRYEELADHGVKMFPDHLIWDDKKFLRSVSLQNKEAAISLAESYNNSGESCLVIDSAGMLTIWKQGKEKPENSVSAPKNEPNPPLTVNQETSPSSSQVVLIVDDSPIVRAIIKRFLNSYFQIMMASSALDALTILNTNNIALILLDIMMPDIDGIEFCRTIRKIPRFKKLPIIMLTAKDNLLDKMKGHIAGTNRYLTKPISPYELLQAVAEFIPTNYSDSNK